MSVPDPAPAAGALAAFWAYERALMTGDLAGQARAFAVGLEPIRSDLDGTLVGSDAIGALRARRPSAPRRRVDRVHVRELGDGAVAIVAEGTRADAGLAAQTQVWRRGADEAWRVVAAHVSSAPAPQRRPAESGPGAWRLRLDDRGGAAPRVAVKDLFAVAGHSRGVGHPTLEGEAPAEPEHAWAVQRLVDDGGVVAGIAHTDELAFGLSGINEHLGTVENPAVPGHLAGGSSSGSAAAVAGGEADIGLGTDTAGSIRVPASYCGLVGLRTTHGAVSLAGVQPLAPSFDVVGLLGREVATVRRAATSLGLPAGPRGIDRLVTVPAWTALADDALVASFDAALTALAGRSGLGVDVVHDAALSSALEEWFTAFRVVQAHEAWTVHHDLVESRPDVLSASVRSRLLAGADVDAERLEALRSVLATARVTVLDLVGDGALVLPATSGPALPLDVYADTLDDARARTLRLCCVASLAGLPSLAVPALRVGPLPAAYALVAGPGRDLALLDLVDHEPW